MDKNGSFHMIGCDTGKPIPGTACILLDEFLFPKATGAIMPSNATYLAVDAYLKIISEAVNSQRFPIIHKISNQTNQ